MSRLATEEIHRLKGVTKPEGIFLLEHVTGKNISRMIIDKTVLSDEEKKAFDRLIDQRRSGTPIQLLIGNVVFLDFKLEVRPGVFIPRPETEQMVERIFEGVNSPPETILDLGTGTGAIAIALARRYPEAKILASDLSTEALDLAVNNARRLEVGNQITFIKADLFSFPEAGELSGKVDLLTSNPPYIPSSMLEELPREVRNFDPVLALDGGPEGFSVLERILRELHDYLAPDGLGVFEIDHILERPLRDFEAISNLVFSYEVDNYQNLRFLFVRHR